MTQELLDLALKRIETSKQLLGIRIRMRELLTEEAEILCRACSPESWLTVHDGVDYHARCLKIPLQFDYQGYCLRPMVTPSWPEETLTDPPREFIKVESITNLWWALHLHRHPTHIFVNSGISKIYRWLKLKKDFLSLEGNFNETPTAFELSSSTMLRDKLDLLERLWEVNFQKLGDYRAISNQSSKEFDWIRNALAKELSPLGFNKSEKNSSKLVEKDGEISITGSFGNFTNNLEEIGYDFNLEVKGDHRHLWFEAGTTPEEIYLKTLTQIKRMVADACMVGFTKQE